MSSKYIKALFNLLPEGFVIPKEADNSELGGVLDVIAQSLQDAETAADSLRNDLFPDTVSPFTDDWHRILGFPRCGIVPATQQSKVDVNLAWLNINEFSNAQFYIDIAAVLGFTIIIEDLGGATTNTIEKIINGGFTADSDWTKGTGWAIAAGVASKSAGTASNLSQADAVVQTASYDVEFTISNYVAGSVTPSAGSGGTGTARSANGTFSETIVAAASDDFLLVADATFDADIDNVSVKPTIPIGGLAAHQWRVISTFTAPTIVFKIGAGVMGDKLVDTGSNDPLECLIEFFAPAHTEVLFEYI